jgi:pimeloyl-ACP methyl ester carboxylesterase
MRYLIFIFFICLGNLACLNKFVYTASKKDIQLLFNDLSHKNKQQYLYYNKVKININTIGDSTKPLLVIVHGAPGEWYNSYPNFLNQSLLNNFFIVTYDRPGYGKSDNAAKAKLIDYQTKILAAVIAHVNPNNQPIHLLARSYGTPIAANYAATFSSQIQKLVLVGSTTAPAYERIFWFSYLGKIDIFNLFLPKSLISATKEKFAHKKELKKIEPNYKNISCPTYVLHGTKDWIADSLNLYYNLANFTNTKVKAIMINNAPHNIIGAEPAYIRSILIDSL